MISAPNRTSQFIAYLQMMRPANIVTAWADILAGYAVLGWAVPVAVAVPDRALFWLLLSTTGLYGGGVVFNDVFDAQLDAVERPERPIPSGRCSIQSAVGLGVLLLSAGIVAAAQVSVVSAAIATAIALTAVFYDAVGKHQPVVGALNMGLCRGGNLLLGMSAVPVALQDRGLIGLIPVAYIAAITLTSQGEVNGGNRSVGIIALVLLALVGSSIVGLAAVSDLSLTQLILALSFLMFWLLLVVPPFFNAARYPSAEVIRLAVKSGVIALIALDGAISASFGDWGYGLVILSLLPVSRLLAKQFAVT